MGAVIPGLLSTAVISAIAATGPAAALQVLALLGLLLPKIL